MHWEKKKLLAFPDIFLLIRLQQVAGDCGKRVCLCVKSAGIHLQSPLFISDTSCCCWAHPVHTDISSWQTKTGRIWREILLFKNNLKHTAHFRFRFPCLCFLSPISIIITFLLKPCGFRLWQALLKDNWSTLKPFSMAPYFITDQVRLSEGLFSFPADLTSIIFFPVMNPLGLSSNFYLFTPFAQNKFGFTMATMHQRLGLFSFSRETSLQTSASLSFKERLQYKWQQGL